MKTKTEQMLSYEERRQMLVEIMKHYRIDTKAELARRLGLTAQNISGWFTKDSFNVELVAVKFPEISGDWLLRREGPMLKRERDAREEDTIMEVTSADAKRALIALVQEQKLTAKAQEQADKILEILRSLAASFKRLSNQ